uniref:hypothetical protein n=1 Tax=Escherichia coli TaxID=562 RepID=UPI001953F285
VLVDDRKTSRRIWPVLALAVLVVRGSYGAFRLSREPTRWVENVKLRIMQPNLPQDAKFNYGAKAEVMR